MTVDDPVVVADAETTTTTTMKIIARASSSKRSSTTGVDRRAETVTFRQRVSRRGGGSSTDDDDDEVVVTVRQNRGDIAVDPTARWVWDACPLVCEYLCDGDRVDALVRGRRVVELGAGTGMPGLVCSKLGAASVTLTDLPSELALLEENVELNRARGDSPVCVRACAWGELEEPTPTFDTVVVSDVLYHQPVRVLEALAETIHRLVAPNGVVVFAYHFRENLMHDSQFFEFIDRAFDERARVSFEDAPNVWLYEWTPKK
jgi:predicted nicotinamide N-methyase